MQNKLLKIVLSVVAGFVIPFVLLQMLTHFVLLPSLAVSGLMTLSAIATYAAPRGVPIALSALVIFSVFSISMILVSPLFSATPQSGGSFAIPLVATLTSFAALMLFGFRKKSRRHEPTQ